MSEAQAMEEMVELLEANGEIRLSNYEHDIFIQSVDNKEGYSYVSNTNNEFSDSSEAIEWAIEQFDGVENIEEWE